jgi:hypothetical protein
MIHRRFCRRFFCCRFFSARAISVFGTASSPRVKFVSRSSGVSPEILTFIGSVFCRVEVAASRG